MAKMLTDPTTGKAVVDANGKFVMGQEGDFCCPVCVTTWMATWSCDTLSWTVSAPSVVCSRCSPANRDNAEQWVDIDACTKRYVHIGEKCFDACACAVVEAPAPPETTPTCYYYWTAAYVCGSGWTVMAAGRTCYLKAAWTNISCTDSITTATNIAPDPPTYTPPACSWVWSASWTGSWTVTSAGTTCAAPTDWPTSGGCTVTRRTATNEAPAAPTFTPSCWAWWYWDGSGWVLGGWGGGGGVGPGGTTLIGDYCYGTYYTEGDTPPGTGPAPTVANYAWTWDCASGVVSAGRTCSPVVGWQNTLVCTQTCVTATADTPTAPTTHAACSYKWAWDCSGGVELIGVECHEPSVGDEWEDDGCTKYYWTETDTPPDTALNPACVGYLYQAWYDCSVTPKVWRVKKLGKVWGRRLHDWETWEDGPCVQWKVTNAYEGGVLVTPQPDVDPPTTVLTEGEQTWCCAKITVEVWTATCSGGAWSFDTHLPVPYTNFPIPTSYEEYANVAAFLAANPTWGIHNFKDWTGTGNTRTYKRLFCEPSRSPGGDGYLFLAQHYAECLRLKHLGDTRPNACYECPELPADECADGPAPDTCPETPLAPSYVAHIQAYIGASERWSAQDILVSGSGTDCSWTGTGTKQIFVGTWIPAPLYVSIGLSPGSWTINKTTPDAILADKSTGLTPVGTYSNGYSVSEAP